MGGLDTIAGIAYQQAYTLHLALDVLDDETAESLRVEGLTDIVDVEIRCTQGRIARGVQVKSRREPYTWSQAEILTVLKRWAATEDSDHGTFEFATNGRLGPTGKALKEALDLAKTGREERLTELLGERPGPALLAVLKRCTVRSSTDATPQVIQRAATRVVAHLAGLVGAGDATERARMGVNELYRALFERGGEPDPANRLFRRAELAGLLGVDATRRAPQFRWATAVRPRYTHAIGSRPLLDPKTHAPLPTGFAPKVLATFERGQPQRESPERMLQSRETVILHGRTGTGKTTAVHALRRTAGSADRAVIVLHAEAYVPGRLVAQLASEVSRVIGEEVPQYTAREVIADADAALVIDGVSEIPEGTRNGMQEELQEKLFHRGGAQVILVGRDVAALRSVVPVSCPIEDFSMVPVDREGRENAAATVLEVRNGKMSAVVLAAQVEEALGDAAGNPMLLTMGLSLVAEGRSFENVGALYEQFVSLMARRSGTTDIAKASLGLGYIFSRLLDSGRRYADPIDWDILKEEAVQHCKGLSLQILEKAVSRSGLVVPVGDTQLLTTAHDSFADYLAAVAHVRGVSTLPSPLMESDSQRVLFVAELAGVSSELARCSVATLPFTAARIARFDERLCDAKALEEVSYLLSLLRPHGAGTGVRMGRLVDGRLVAARDGTGVSKWLEPEAARALISGSFAVCLPSGGPLRVATELWRLELARALRSGRTMPTARPQTADEARELVERNARDAHFNAMRLLEELFGGVAATAVLAELGDLGLRVVISPSYGNGEKGWTLSYHPSAETEVTIGILEGERWEMGRTTVEAFLDDPPLAAARDRIRKAVAGLTPHGWI